MRFSNAEGQKLIDLQREPPLRLADVAKRCGVTPCTVWRWTTTGVRPPGGGPAVRLECIRVGGRRLTTERALQQFIAATNAPPAVRTVPTPAQRRRQEQTTADRRRRLSELAEAELQRLGA